MNSLLVDRTTWDLLKDASNNIAMASDPYALAQNVACACKLFLGELYYNTSKGVPYFTNILGQLYSLQLIQTQLEYAAMTVTGVANASANVTAFKGRKITGQITFTDDNGVTQSVVI